MDKLEGVEIILASDVVELTNSEIIITATPSTIPVLPDDKELLKGKHIIAIGSYKYEMRELPPALYQVLDDVYIDTELAAEESGDLIVPVEEGWMTKEDYKIFGKVYDELVKADKSQVKTTLYKSVGMALFDLLVAEAIYKSALDKKIGIQLGE